MNDKLRCDRGSDRIKMSGQLATQLVGHSRMAGWSGPHRRSTESLQLRAHLQRIRVVNVLIVAAHVQLESGAAVHVALSDWSVRYDRDHDARSGPWRDSDRRGRGCVAAFGRGISMLVGVDLGPANVSSHISHLTRICIIAG